uniref:ribosomal protein S2 n=1 Tax=Skeletonema pseudocostatum TaxID=41457 RepID=UPI001D110F5B|nr:ribosomal protein S2 [Skeletonema pseudocostatum]UBA16173.1 ribosomal protein S2 [Skeletonema pseudocostatum]
MKVNLVKSQNHKLFKYNLLKLQIYSDQPSFDILNFSNDTLEYIEAHLKQVLKIIFEYHVCQFKILFIGFPVISKMKQMKLIHFTNHTFISEKSWISGIFRNRFSILTYLKVIQSKNFSKSLKLLLTVKTKPHLVVIFNQKIETIAINEFYKAGIPILSFNCIPSNSTKITYKTLGYFNFVQKNIKITYFFLFYSLLKKLPLKKNKIKNIVPNFS